MSKSFVELVVGNLEDKKEYRQLMKRVKDLPEEYSYAFKKIQHYLYYFDSPVCTVDLLTDLVEMFELHASEGKKVLDVIGSDVAAFCDRLMETTSTDYMTPQQKLNKEIQDYFNRKEA